MPDSIPTRGPEVTQPRRSRVIQVAAVCHGCPWHGSGADAPGAACEHHHETGHGVVVEIRESNYTDYPALASPDEKGN